ncbi:F0F1 ATP synthase subunit B family protein [Helicobacter suis]|uniref:F0F1 ATP synthase subunit B family protein n=1 Tax=Helicobacter suis TaxID=104628 RepID=UPI001E553C73|nr:hypothetical protein [Helicobacter suis]
MLQRVLVGVMILSAMVAGTPMQVGQTDIVMRVLNFLLFLGILWYFTGSMLKKALLKRRSKISDKLSSLQDQRQSIKEEKEQALSTLEQAKQQASQIVSSAKQEAYLLTQKYDQQSKIVIEKLIKNYRSMQEKEEEKMQEEAIAEVLDTLFNASETALSVPVYMRLIHQKVVQ